MPGGRAIRLQCTSAQSLHSDCMSSAKATALIVEQSAASLIHWATGGPSLGSRLYNAREPPLYLSIEPVRASQFIVEPRGTLPLSPPASPFNPWRPASPWMLPAAALSPVCASFFSPRLDKRPADDQLPFWFYADHASV